MTLCQHTLLGGEPLGRALRILKLVRLGRLSETQQARVYVQAYSNGREQGFAVVVQDLMLAFAEHRRSDAIVVYVGRLADFSAPGNVPSDEVYRAAKLFEARRGLRAAEREAARYIQALVTHAAKRPVPR